MGNKIGSDTRLAHLRSRVFDILPDTAQVFTPTRVTTASGSATTADGDPLLYNGLPDVPCRVDISKHYRSADIVGEETIVNDFEIHFPWDFPVEANHKIVINNERYEVQKLLDTNSFRVTRVALASRVDLGNRS